jgi:uncharacterized protein (TIGR02145 family)
MRTKLFKIAQAATLGFAITFTLSCSSNGDDPNGGGKGTPVTYEGETYETVVIGTQTWMARNLSYDASGSKCYGDDPANCAKYGRLYSWATAMALPSNCNSSSCASQIGAKHKGICPTGWHIPSDEEWTTLTDYIETSKSCTECAGKYLKATSGWNENGNGMDEFGFSALPGGNGYFGDGSFSFYYVYDRSCWWSTSEDNRDDDEREDYPYVYTRYMNYNYEDVTSGSSSKDDLLHNVRCLQD